ncbi:cupin [Rossellomorea aquimaris]|uniref:cupin n=1 Tax=Rossellomorea aquimaris TaxID=189382 RepID=UPI001CD1F53F|nr:cupin [Rossellomorea aquimaris]MCA1053762.1 cupin [Rossellomorea aquimaris]
MKIYTFKQGNGKKITQFDSDFIMSRIVMTSKEAHIGCMYLEENGLIGDHQAVVPQLLLIVHGEGIVRGEDRQLIPVTAGDAVFWEKDEWHETRSSEGLAAIVIESPELDPSPFMKLRD